VLVKEARSTVADDDVAIGEWAKIGSVISVDFLKVPVAEADVRFGAQSGLKSDIARGPKSASRRHSISDASPHSAAGLIFCNLSLAASRRNISLRFLTLAVAAPAHHHWCQFFIAARW